MADTDYDVIVVGAGNAAACAALAAQDAGADRIVMLERAPEDEAGGNTRFTAGAMRVVYDGVEDIKKLVELSNQEVADTDFGTYTQDQFFDDILSVASQLCIRNFSGLFNFGSKGVLIKFFLFLTPKLKQWPSLSSFNDIAFPIPLLDPLIRIFLIYY